MSNLIVPDDHRQACDRKALRLPYAKVALMSRTVVLVYLLFISVTALAAETPEESEHRKLAQDFIALHIDKNKLSRIFDDASISMVRKYEDRFYVQYKRNLSQSDKIALAQFFKEKLEQAIPLEQIDLQLAESVLMNTTYEELASINAFLNSPAGHKLSSLRNDLSIVTTTIFGNMVRAHMTSDRITAIRIEIESKFPAIAVPWGD